MTKIYCILICGIFLFQSQSFAQEPSEKDIVYASIGERDLHLDLYLPDNASGPLTLVIWIHGGGFRRGTKDKIKRAVHLLALLGTTNDVKTFDTHEVCKKASPEVQAVCNWFGPTGFLRMNDYPGRMDHDAPDSPESLFIGGPIQENPELVKKAKYQKSKVLI